MKRITIMSAFVLIILHINAQHEDKTWIFGRPFSGSTNATLYFGNVSNPVVSLPGGQPNSITANNGKEQWAVVTNPFTGDIIFYTDGKNVFDQQHNLVGNVDLGANVSSSQPVAISPVPRSELKSSYNQYYIFSNETGASITAYDIGKVTYRMYNITTQTFGPANTLPGPYGNADVTEGMKIIPNDTNPDILWLVVSLFPHQGLGNKYVVYKIDKSIVTYHADFDLGPQKMAVQSGASPIVYINYSNANTPVGISTVGFALQYEPSIFVCQFDNLNGNFLANTLKACNTGYTGTIPSVYNLEFSPGGNFLYYSVYRTSSNTNALFQVDLQDSVLTKTQIATFNHPYAGGLKAGPDSLIYHIYDDGYQSNILRLGRILQPEQKFIPGVTQLNQFYEQSFLSYNNVFGIGLCEFLVLPAQSPVPPIGLDEKSAKREFAVRITPNPATDYIDIRVEDPTDGPVNIGIYNLQGSLILSETVIGEEVKRIFTCNRISAGIYLIKVSNRGLVYSSKLIIR